MSDVTIMVLNLLIVILCAAIVVALVYSIVKDTKSKEQMFQIQMMAAQSKSLKDALSPTEMYKIVADMIQFYVSKMVVLSDLEGKTDSELSILLDNIIVSISTEVELHLSDTFKRSWETYFDKVDGTDDITSHLKIYVACTVRTRLVQIIETMKRGEALSKSKSRRQVQEGTSSHNNSDNNNE